MVRWLLVVPAVLLFLLVDGGAHYYVAKCMIFEAGLVSPWREMGLAVVVAGFLLLLAHPIGERLLRPSSARWIVWPSSIWMGVLFLMLVGLLASEAVLLLSSGVAFAAETDGGVATSVGPVRAAVIGLLVGVGSVLGLREGLRGPRDVRVEIEMERWPRALDGYRIAQITDIHIGALLGRDFAAELTRRVNALDADLVAVTGDLVDGSPRHLSDEVLPFAELRGRDGVFFVCGNHDFYSGVEPWAELARSLGMRVLRNEHTRIAPQAFAGAQPFVLAGVDDHRQRMLPGDDGEDLGAALAGLDPETDRPVVLLAHDPSTFKRAHEMGIDLQISGHTHGGQIWPFRYLVRAAIPFVEGRYRRGEAELYVSRGSGFWGPPMRLFAPAEITEIVLRAPRRDGRAPQPATAGIGVHGTPN